LGRRGLCHCWGLHELLGWVGRLGLSTHVGVHSLVTSVTSVANFFTDTELPQYLFEATLVSNIMFPNLLRPFFLIRQSPTRLFKNWTTPAPKVEVPKKNGPLMAEIYPYCSPSSFKTRPPATSWRPGSRGGSVWIDTGRRRGPAAGFISINGGPHIKISDWVFLNIPIHGTTRPIPDQNAE